MALQRFKTTSKGENMEKETALALRVILANMRTSPLEEGAKSARLLKELKDAGRSMEAGEVLSTLKTAACEICAPDAARIFEESLCCEWEKS